MPNPAQTRRDPQNGKKGFSNKGFTLVEMMIAIAVLAIIASLALPSYRTIIEKRQVTSGAEQLSGFVSAVQIEAVRRNEPIAVRYMRSDAETWCVGLVVVEPGSTSDTPCNCSLDPLLFDPDNPGAYCQIDRQLRVLQSDNLNYPKIMNSMDGDGAFAFDPVRGLLIEPTETAEFELVSDEATYALNVQVTGTGRVKMCSKDVAGNYVPGYETCRQDF